VSREIPPFTGGGGIGSYVASAGPGLVAAGHQVHVLSCAPGQASSDVDVDGMAVHRRPVGVIHGLRRIAGKPGGLRLEAAASVYRELDRLGTFDVAEVPDWLGEGLLVSWRGAVPTVSQLHTPHRLTQEYLGRSWDRADRVADWVERSAVRRSTLTVSPSKLIVEELRTRGWLDDREVEIIRYAVDWQRWGAVDPVERTEPVVAVLGRVEPRKGQAELVEAVARAAVPGARLLLLGQVADPAYAEAVRSRAAQLGVDVTWAGQVPRAELPERLGGVRVVAVPSTFESFSMVTLEAMAAARPVVLSTAVGAGELLTGTSAGCVVPLTDIDGWAGVLSTYLTDPAEAASAGEHGKRLVREHCDPLTVAAKRVRAYERAIALHDERRHRRAR